VLRASSELATHQPLSRFLFNNNMASLPSGSDTFFLPIEVVILNGGLVFSFLLLAMAVAMSSIHTSWIFQEEGVDPIY
jgi:hypothetical protein